MSKKHLTFQKTTLFIFTLQFIIHPISKVLFFFFIILLKYYLFYSSERERALERGTTQAGVRERERERKKKK